MLPEFNQHLIGLLGRFSGFTSALSQHRIPSRFCAIAVAVSSGASASAKMRPLHASERVAREMAFEVRSALGTTSLCSPEVLRKLFS
eukprot:1510125-Karenia_brevis.AAC.1